MLTTLSFRSLRLERFLPTLDSNASLTGAHVVGVQTELESGSFPMRHKFQLKVVLQHFIKTAETMNRLNTEVMMPTGLFCCEVPDATGTVQRVCANIGVVNKNVLT